MTEQLLLGHLLADCTVRLDVGRAARGTAFFAAPQYAVTAAHNIAGVQGLHVELVSQAGRWNGQVDDVRPSPGRGPGPGGGFYPPPDLALIRLEGGRRHSCVPLSRSLPVVGRSVTVRGYSRTFDESAVTAETESFTVTGELDTTDPACTLLKLGVGQAVRGMSGAPVLDATEGAVVGMLRTSRDVHSHLGAWVVSAELIRRIWPELASANDEYHTKYDEWQKAHSASSNAERRGCPESSGSFLIGHIASNGPVGIINSGNFRDVHIGDGGA